MKARSTKFHLSPFSSLLEKWKKVRMELWHPHSKLISCWRARTSSEISHISLSTQALLTVRHFDDGRANYIQCWRFRRDQASRWTAAPDKEEEVWKPSCRPQKHVIPSSWSSFVIIIITIIVIMYSHGTLQKGVLNCNWCPMPQDSVNM